MNVRRSIATTTISSSKSLLASTLRYLFLLHSTADTSIPSPKTSSMATPLSGIHLPSSASAAGTKPSPATTFPPVTQRSLLSPHWNRIWKRTIRLMAVYSAATMPEGISEKVSESIKKAEEACEGDPTSGECVAAWDEVEELSAAASHARDRAKSTSDPLENYCKDNPETKECRTYED